MKKNNTLWPQCDLKEHAKTYYLSFGMLVFFYMEIWFQLVFGSILHVSSIPYLSGGGPSMKISREFC